jgi:sugar lactone lactonase YvrE
MLHGDGTLDYLELNPTSENGGTFKWVLGLRRGQKSAQRYFPFAEGIDVSGNELFFVSKSTKTLFILNLDSGTYKHYTTERGVFDGQPDQLEALVGDGGDLLYFTEDGGRMAGIHARNGRGQFFTILESSEYNDETTGLSFSPDSKHLYIAYQDNGLLFDITRADGLPFNAKTLNVKYHNTEEVR